MQLVGNHFKKVCLFFLLFIQITYASSAQDTLQIDYRIYEELSVSVAYNYSFAEPNEDNFHLLETRIQKQTYGGRHPFFTNISTGLDIGLNTNDFLIGPRIGVLASYGGLVFGTDLTYYTDFSQGTLRLIPRLGFGFHQLHFTINPHVRLSNKNFEPIDRGHLSLTVRLFKIKEGLKRS